MEINSSKNLPVVNIYDWIDEGDTFVKDERKAILAKAIGKASATIYYKMRKQTFSKAEKEVIFRELNKMDGTPEQIEQMFDKDLTLLSQ